MTDDSTTPIAVGDSPNSSELGDSDLVADLRQTLRDDPFVRRLLQFTVVIFIILVSSPSFVGAYVVIFANDLPYFVESFIDNHRGIINAFPSDIISMILGVIPILFAGVCYSSVQAKRRLNTAGRCATMLSILGLVLGLVVLGVLRSETSMGDWLSEIGPPEAIRDMASLVENSSRAMLFYLGIFFGISGSKI